MDDFIGSGGYNSKPNQDQVNAKKWMKIIGIILGVLLVLVVGLIVLMYYIQSVELKISIDNKATSKLKDVLIIDQGKVYIPIRAFAGFVGYESNNAEYENKYTEDKTKCYVECANEVASFSLGSNKIYKTSPNSQSDYEYFEISEPVKIINNQLCTTIDGAQIAFNISMSYDQEANRITIFTLPYLVTYYTKEFQNSGIADSSASFNNQKALLYNVMIVKNANNNYGAQTLKKQEILGTKYAGIEFIESTKEFIVTTTEGKMGIISYDANTKISPEYDQIKQIDKDTGLYLVTNNKKQGVVNSNGSIVIYLEYDQVGIDATKYTSNKIKNQYLLYNKCIPVKKNGAWEIFDKTGKKITNETYEDLGCSASSSKNANSIILVPEYEGIIVKRNNLYGLIDSNGKELIPIALQSIYLIISEGQETYHMSYRDQEINVIDYIKQRKIKEAETENNTENTENTNSQDTTNNEQNNSNVQENNNTTQTNNN